MVKEHVGSNGTLAAQTSSAVVTGLDPGQTPSAASSSLTSVVFMEKLHIFSYPGTEVKCVGGTDVLRFEQRDREEEV